MEKNPYLKKELKHFLHTFKRQPLQLVKAKGSWVWDDKGRKYLDLFSGLAVCGVGHNNNQVINAIQQQSKKLLHTSNYFYTQPQSKLAEQLTARWKGSRVFFCNSGGEANELAIKLARLWATRNKKKGREIITFTNAFHGRTLATMAASKGETRTTDVFEPIPVGFKAVPYNDLAKAKAAISSKTIAILLEPIQGEGGIHIATPEFLKGLAALCKKHKLLLILDEVQSGMGRTGTFFAFEQYGVKPDIVTLAKGLAGGLPLGATLAQEHVSKHVVPGLHGSTFGGNPVACAAALEVLKLLSPQALRSIQKSAYELKRALAPFQLFPSVKQIRLKGLMVGIELHGDGQEYVTLARKKGLLINCTQGKVVRLLPPYFMSPSEMKKGLQILTTVFNEMN